MSLWAQAPEPPSELGRYRVLSSTAGIRVSPLQLGAMSIGSQWGAVLGSMDKEASFKLMDAYFDLGGNMIDTSSNYQNEESETWIGEWMAARKNRDRLVIATKFTTDYRSWEIGPGNGPNFCGNHRRNLHTSVRDSLKKLQTEWIDLLYVHWWDFTTSIEEMMDSLDIMVKQGKVLYLGASDMPAWIVAAANVYATSKGKTPFSVYQGNWNVMLRDFERDIIPMARHFGMALAPWGAVGSGKFQTKKEIEAREQRGETFRPMQSGGKMIESELKMSEALAQVAAEHGIESVTAVALAYVMAKTPNVFPIVGGRKVEHLKDNIQALSIKLTDKQIEFLESQTKFDVGFPNNFIGTDVHLTGKASGLLGASAQYAFVKYPTAIGHE